MPPKAANKKYGLKPEIGSSTRHRNAATRVYFSRVAGFFFLSFFRKLRKKKIKSCISSKSCQIRKTPLTIEFLRRPYALKRNDFLFAGLALFVVIIDQVSKWLAATHLEPHQIISAIPGFFNIVLVKNRGMAFGIFNQTQLGFSHYLLLGTTIAAIGIILFFFIWTKRNHLWMAVGLSLIMGGAVGNLIDRVKQGFVIDFLDFYLGGYHWPAFNIADSAVTVGTFWVFINVIRGKSI
jgi:signal peptidase II